jgi:hypothetical protein
MENTHMINRIICFWTSYPTFASECLLAKLFT